MNEEHKALRIVPAPPREGCIAHSTMGTQVLTPEGAPVPGITKVTLIAEVGEPWRAVIECMVEPPDVTALADVFVRHPKEPKEVPWAEAHAEFNALVVRAMCNEPEALSRLPDAAGTLLRAAAAGR